MKSNKKNHLKISDINSDTIRNQIQTHKLNYDKKTAEINKKAGRNLAFAFFTGIFFALVFIASFFLWPIGYYCLALLLCTITSFELSLAVKKAKQITNPWYVSISNSSIVLLVIFYGELGFLFGYSSILFVTLVLSLFHKNKTNVFFTYFMLHSYIALCTIAAILIANYDRGSLWVFSLVLVTVAVDIGAYAFGIKFGKHKMAPRLSPNKTWEGFLGALVLSGVVAALLGIFLLKENIFVVLLWGVLVFFAATVGDLIESLIKRDLGIKDMSNWIPGHGGFFDRLDSIFPAATVTYLIVHLVSLV